MGICCNRLQARTLSEELSFSDVIDISTTPDVRRRLKEICPKAVNIYIDNGMEGVSDEVILQVRKI